VTILDRIEVRDGDAAAGAMREHITSMWQRKRDHMDAPGAMIGDGTRGDSLAAAYDVGAHGESPHTTGGSER
jgi:hypothetical protein